VVLLLEGDARLLQVGPQLPPALLAVQTLVLRRAQFGHLCGHAAVQADDHVEWQVVPLGDLEVVEIVRWGDLEGPGAELAVHVLVGDHGHGASLQGHEHLLPDEVPVARVLWVHAHRRVAQDGLWSCRGHWDELILTSLDHVLEMVEVAGLLGILHLQVADRGLQHRTPVHHAVAAVDHAHLVEPNKRLDDG